MVADETVAVEVVEAVAVVGFAVAETVPSKEEQCSATQSPQAEEVPVPALPVGLQHLQLLVVAHTGGEDVVPGEVEGPEDEEEGHTGVLVVAAVEVAAVDAFAPIDHSTRIARAYGEEAAEGSNHT